MRTDIITLGPKGANVQIALSHIEGLGRIQGLSHKDALHLRLLTEEVLSIVSIAVTDFTAKLWAESEGKIFKIVLEANVDTSVDATGKLLSLSSTGKNEANQGLGQKIASIFRIGVGGKTEDDYSWSLNSYKKEIQKHPDPSVKIENMEKSIIANLASDVRVSIKNGKALMIVEKKFNEE